MVGLKTSCAVLTLTLVFIACYVEFTSAAGAQLVLSGTVRDQAPNTMAHNRFPADYWSYNGWTDNPTLGSCGNANNSQGWANTDFELPLYYYGTIKTPNAKGGVLYNGEVGLVGGVCNATNQWVNCGKLNPDDHTPIYAHTGPSPFGTIRSPQSFATWFHAGPTTIAVPYNLTLTQSTGRLYTYNAPFFPIDGRGWADSNQGDTNGVNHNFAFCFEIHGHFSYQGGETFSFTGDDDVWVYLDSRLMIDLGGIHTQLSATVNLDDIAGLTRGNNYRFDFFYCERHTTASDMQITTSLEIACTYYDWCDICEGTGQSCCTAQDLIECADTNACTNDSCAVLVPPQTGCQHVDITPTCPGNKCFLAGCDPAIGCTQTPVPCNDGKRCTVDTCVNSTGCVFTNYQCPGDACNVAVCSETGTMCTTTKTNCDDNNACTVDTCDPVHGCQHVALVCAQDFCHSSTCDTVAGCQNTTKNCDDSNACTKDTCDNASGCKNTQIPCGNGDKCLTFNCDPNTGCANVTKSCDDNNICTIDTCNSVTGCSNVQDPCDDGNACTIDTCSPTLGGCQHNPLPCDDHNMCTNNTCDPLSGCVYPPIVCNDNNACTNDTCIPASGCYYPPLVCSSSDKCVNATCDIVSGCQFPSISCNDQNPCTADSCDHASGCKNVPTDCNHCAYPNGSYVYCAPEGGNWCFPLSCDPNSGNCNISQPVVCNDQNACTNDTCNGADGTCSYPKITCNDNNPCTQDTCNPNSGCVFTNNTCDDNNPCTMDSCNHADGSCINTPVAGNCIACGPDPCTWTDVCNPKVCDNNVCTVQPYSCDDGNLCTNDVCDNSGVNATCHFPQKNCTAADACNPSSCDLTSGQCLTTPFDCDDANPCTDDTCSVGTDGKPVCANNRRDCPGSTACLPQVCNEDTGECEINNPPSCDDLNYCTDDNCVSITDSVWNCTHDTHDCTGFDTGNLCVLPICIPDTGCAPAASSICDDGNFCTDDECVGPLNCTHTLTSICDDNDACTNDFCDPSLAQADACSHTNLTCYPPTICQNATGCNATTGCIFEPLVCVLNTTDFCLVPNCDLTAGCIPIPRTCLVDDPGCYQGVCDSVLGQCTQQALPDWTTITSSKGNGLSCYAYYNKGELAGIITGGAIAGIVVGAVVFAAAATVAARKAYLYAQLRAGGMGAAQANPLYTPGATEGVNPLFT